VNTSIDIQVSESSDVDSSDVPSAAQLRAWAEAALKTEAVEGSLCLRVVGEVEGHRLNADFRGKDRATNVLAFPVSSMLAPEQGILGDIAICAPVVCREAAENEAGERHWAHMVVHGVLHLLGHDHQEPVEARHMASCEDAILTKLGFADEQPRI